MIIMQQIYGYKPKRLIIFDIYENNVYNVQQEPEVKRGF